MDHAERILIETQIYEKTFFIEIYGFSKWIDHTFKVISSHEWPSPNSFSPKILFWHHPAQDLNGRLKNVGGLNTWVYTQKPTFERLDPFLSILMVIMAENFWLLIPGLEKRVLRMNKRVFLCTFLRRPLPNNVFATNLPQSQSLISLKTNSPSTMKIQVPDKTRDFDLLTSLEVKSSNEGRLRSFKIITV